MLTTLRATSIKVCYLNSMQKCSLSYLIFPRSIEDGDPMPNSRMMFCWRSGRLSAIGRCHRGKPSLITTNWSIRSWSCPRPTMWPPMMTPRQLKSANQMKTYPNGHNKKHPHNVENHNKIHKTGWCYDRILKQAYCSNHASPNLRSNSITTWISSRSTIAGTQTKTSYDAVPKIWIWVASWISKM